MKKAEEIYRDMMASFAQKTGVEASGSGDLAVRLWAVAAEIESLYAQSDWTARQCFPQSATGESLDKHAAVRGLTRRAPSCAVGVLTFVTDTAQGTALTIPKGTVCMTAGLVRFETNLAATIPAGATQVDVAAHAVEPGAPGNAAGGTILVMAVPPVGISRCLNAAPFEGGREGEEDGALRSRVLETYARLPNGANVAFYEQGAMSMPQVAAVRVVSRPRGVGTVDVVVAAAEGLPDAALLTALGDYFKARREIAVEVQVKAPTIQNVPISVKVKPAAGETYDTVKTKVEAALRGYFSGALLGKDILRARLGELIFSVPGVENYSITAPSGDVVISPSVLPKLSALSVTELV